MLVTSDDWPQEGGHISLRDLNSPSGGIMEGWPLLTSKFNIPDRPVCSGLKEVELGVSVLSFILYLSTVSDETGLGSIWGFGVGGGL